MRFKIGSDLYAVRVASKPIKDENGARDGLCDPRNKELLISPDVPPEKRLWVALHELGHGWVRAVGRPKGEEGLCNFLATAFVEFHRDLSKNGGEFALQRLGPGESPQPMANRVMLTKSRYCGTCHSTIAGGSVVCVPDDKQPGTMLLTIYCEMCDVLQVWREMATPTGIPSGVVVGEPRRGTKEETKEFLRVYGELYGVFSEG